MTDRNQQAKRIFSAKNTTKMSLFIQLAIVSVAALMVQAAPVTRGMECTDYNFTLDDFINNKSPNVSKLEHLYCVTNSLKELIRKLPSDMTVTVPPKVITNTNTKKTLERMIGSFSDRCKNYTQALSLKHQLQDYLLHDNSPAADFDRVNSYSSMLVSLQTMISILDDYEFIQHKRHCVTLTPAHYKKIYYVVYGEPALLDTMLKEMGNWLRTIRKDIEVPHSCTCELFYMP